MDLKVGRECFDCKNPTLFVAGRDETVWKHLKVRQTRHSDSVKQRLTAVVMRFGTSCFVSLNNNNSSNDPSIRSIYTDPSEKVPRYEIS